MLEFSGGGSARALDTSVLCRLEGVRDVQAENGSVQMQVTELHRAVPALLNELGRQGIPLTELRTRSADEKLKKIDTRGGPPITLADAPVSFGGSWSPNGVILFSPSWRTVYKVSSAGGNAAPVASAAAVGNLQCCPRFLPDGEHFLFAAETRQGSDSKVKLFVGSLNSVASKVIGEATNAAYAQERLLYLKDNVLVAQPFNAKALQTTGEPEVVAEGIGQNRSTFQLGFFTVSSSGMLAYLPAPRYYGRQLTWFDRAGKALGTIGTPRAFYDIEFSPDRKRLAASVAAAGNIDVWTYDLTRGAPTRFTFDPAAEFRGMWSPDGRSIMFNSTRSGHADLYRKSADGAGAEDQLYADTTEKYPVSWSRDGKLLLYSTGGGAQGRELWVLPLAPERTIAALKPQPFLKSSPFGQFSPDGRWVAYESDERNPPRSTSSRSRGQWKSTRSRLTEAQGPGGARMARKSSTSRPLGS